MEREKKTNDLKEFLKRVKFAFNKKIIHENGKTIPERVKMMNFTL